MFNRSRSSQKPVTPTAEYYPAAGDAKLLVRNHKLEVLFYVPKDLLLTDMVLKLIIPGLVDQLHSFKNKILPDVLIQESQLLTYHFIPSGFLHPVTAIYELSYGETELKQGWGCAFRSLQTIISWFRQQHYTSIDVPSHRQMQQSLVEIGDKDPSFIGSREWIGAIELSFVLDKLLGVSCKVINVRSGAELPEKCRELALHFETQGTPIMIRNSYHDRWGCSCVYSVGVDYNDVSGNCAFLILDPHYTGNDELKKIVNGGWCGWKKAVDGKGKHFFLHDKFYNLLLPQRPNMV